MKLKCPVVGCFLLVMGCSRLLSQTATNIVVDQSLNSSKETPCADGALAGSHGYVGFESAGGQGAANPGSNRAAANSEAPSALATDVDDLKSQGYSYEDIDRAQVLSPTLPSQSPSNPGDPQSPKTLVCMDYFLGVTNAVVAADVLSAQPQYLKLRLNGRDCSYVGNYAVMFSSLYAHKNPAAELRPPELADSVVLRDVNGDTFPLQNVTILERQRNFIDVLVAKREWINSGPYTIQK